MELPKNKLKTQFISDVNIVNTKLQTVIEASGHNQAERLSSIQELIDKLADRYQNNEQLGNDRYKLYELQALTHYFQENDSDAREFINHAIEVRGESYPKAERLLEKLQQHSSFSETRKKANNDELWGVRGWLALFVVGVVIVLIMNAVSLWSYPTIFDDLAQASAEYSNLANSLRPVLVFEVIHHIVAIGLGFITVVLILMRKKTARYTAILYIAANLLFVSVDYFWAASVMSGFPDIFTSSEVSEGGEEVGRSLLYAAIWIPYFIKSKRVKTTLIE